MDTKANGMWDSGPGVVSPSRLSLPGAAWARLRSWLGLAPLRPHAEPPALVASVRQLMQLRAVAVTGQIAAIGAAVAMDVALDWRPMTAIIGVLVAMNAATWMRVRRAAPATHAEICAHLGFDLGAFTLLLLLAGGNANPFALLYVLHAVLVGLLLPTAMAVGGVALVVACVTVAVRWQSPLRMIDGTALPAPLLVLGQWTSLALTALVTAWFVARIASSLRRHERDLGEAERRLCRDEIVMRVGALAAGAAHELATPLTTMAVLAGEMRHEQDASVLRRDVGVLAAQIAACRNTLDSLMATAMHARAGPDERVEAGRFLEAVASRFRTLRPGVFLVCQWTGNLPVPVIEADAGLKQAILILLNNAADASPHDVELIGHWDAEMMQVTVRDRGPGMPDGMLDRLGRAFFTTKPKGEGTGLGLVLTADVARRLSGTVRWSNRPEGGSTVDLRLPLAALASATP